MVITLKPYSPISKPNEDESSAIDFKFRILTRYGAVLIDFDKFTDVLSYSDSLNIDGGDVGQWSMRLKATSDNLALLKNLHPGLCIEIYAARNTDPLEGVIRDPSKIRRKDTTPDFPEFEVAPVQLEQGAGGGTGGGAADTSLSPARRAMLDVIAWCEGTYDRPNNGYGTVVGYAKEITDFSQHPDIVVRIPGVGTSNAAGRYQFMAVNPPTWEGAKAALGLKDFSPASQDKAAIYLIKQRGVLDAVDRGDMRAACVVLSHEWASLPPPRYKNQGGHKTYEQVQAFFDKRLKFYQGGGGGGAALPTATTSEAKVSVATAVGADPSRAGKVIMQRTGKKDENGLEDLLLTVYDDKGAPISSHTVQSGVASTQTKFGGAFTTRAGSLAPVEFGSYRIGGPVASGEEGVGRIFIPVNPEFDTDRSAIGFHVDANRDKAPGSAGCIVFKTQADFDRFQQSLKQSGASTFEFLREPAPAGATGITAQPAAGPSPNVIGPEVQPIDDPYLDKCPYLLLRGVITDYGRSTDDSSSLTLTGAGYGKIYQDAQVLTDAQSPDLASIANEIRLATQIPLGVSYIWYRVLKEWVENFWGEPTGWEARTRVIPFPPNYITRMNNGGTAYNNLKALSIEGFFHLYCDHTGALCWEKLPWSSKEQSLIAGRNWEDVPLTKLPSWKIQHWDDRISDRGISNFIRCIPVSQGSGSNTPYTVPMVIYNQGSIRQYGGPTKREIYFPIGTDGDQYYTSEPRRKQQAQANTFIALTALECIRWYDRPVQRCGVTVRGDAHFRVATRLELTENWHNLKAKPGEYYVVSRSHSINFERGSWTTSLDMVRDRRQRYLGIGIGEVPIVKQTESRGESLTTTVPSNLQIPDWTKSPIFTQGVTAKPLKKTPYFAPDLDGFLPSIDVPEYHVPLHADDYWAFNRLTGNVERIGNDPIKWARGYVIPKINENPPPVKVELPGVANGIQSPSAGAVSFQKMDRIFVSNLYDPTPPNSYDFTFARGGTPYGAGEELQVGVPAPITGKVIVAGPRGGYGNSVEILGSDGLAWFMGHFNSVSVSVGQTVQKGQVVGVQGWTGNIRPPNREGTHVHLEINRGGGANALPYGSTRGLVRDYFHFACGGKPTYIGGSGL